MHKIVFFFQSEHTTALENVNITLLSENMFSFQCVTSHVMTHFRESSIIYVFQRNS